MSKVSVKGILRLFLIFSLLLPATLAVDVYEEDLQPRYSTIDSFFVDLTITSSGRASLYSSIDTENSSYTISLEMVFQRSTNGRTWTNIQTWSASQIGHISLDKIYYVSLGYDYRIHVTATVTNSSGRVVETATRDSSIVSY